MGKGDKKSAKGRLDKYYHLAKEQGSQSSLPAYNRISLSRSVQAYPSK